MKVEKNIYQMNNDTYMVKIRIKNNNFISIHNTLEDARLKKNELINSMKTIKTNLRDIHLMHKNLNL